MVIGSILALVAASAQPSGVPTTLDALHADPDRFAGRWVRLRGQVDQCFNMSCALCPEDATPTEPLRGRCAALSFDRHAGPHGQGADFDPIYRYATVDLIARFDPACWRSPCTDRASVLMEARVLQVLKRRTSGQGLTPGAAGAITQVQGRDADALVATFMHGATPAISTHFRVYAERGDPDIRRYATLCESVLFEGETDATPGIWPQSTTGIHAPGTEDRYRCYRATRDASGWFIHPN